MHRTALLCLLLSPPIWASAQTFDDIQRRVTEFTLANGIRFLVLQRPGAPVVSFHTYVKAGSVDDPGGQTGLAHMFEHMAFKGTDRIGTTNYREEEQALEAVEKARDQLEAEQAGGPRADPHRLESLEAHLKALIDKANSYVEPNAYPRIIEENGGVGLNATTGEDSTNYFYSLPANRIELWFLLESQRFLRPVFREFYKERDVVREERRLRVESDPEGKLSEMLLATAFAAHPYKQPTAGWASDIEHLRVQDAREFFRRYYAPANITIGIAGDVDARQAKRLADKYFSPLPARPLPPPLHTVEPRQQGEKRVVVETDSQPYLAIAYKRPSESDGDDPVFDVVTGVLDSGRTGLLYKELVRDRKVAVSATTLDSFPGGQYPNLFLIYVVPSAGHTVGENEQAVYEILERLKREPVEEETLERVRTKVRASIIRQLDSNAGMAAQLAFYQVNYGNWRKLFSGLDDLRKVTAADVQRVARQYFVREGRTVAYTVSQVLP